VSTASSGNFSDTAPGTPAGTETVDAKYSGDGKHASSERTCQGTVQPMFL
jgi:hypothetical protein